MLNPTVYRKIYEETLGNLTIYKKLYKVGLILLTKTITGIIKGKKQSFFSIRKMAIAKKLMLEKHQFYLFKFLKSFFSINSRKFKQNMYIVLRLRLAQWRIQVIASRKLEDKVKPFRAEMTHLKRSSKLPDFNPHFFTDQFSNHDEMNLKILQSHMQTSSKRQANSINDSFDSNSNSLLNIFSKSNIKGTFLYTIMKKKIFLINSYRLHQKSVCLIV